MNKIIQKTYGYVFMLDLPLEAFSLGSYSIITPHLPYCKSSSYTLQSNLYNPRAY